MVQQVVGAELFHVTRALDYNTHPPLTVGATLDVGQQHNPFFAFFEQPRRYSVNVDGQEVWVPAMKFLSGVREGSITPNQLPFDAWQIANHFMLLSRELAFEQVRLKERSDAPSRLTCLWCADTLEGARYWANRLGGNATIVKLSATGTIHRVNAALLMGDSEPYSETIRKASEYWQGYGGDEGEPEVLFAGTAKVVSLSPS